MRLEGIVNFVVGGIDGKPGSRYAIFRDCQLNDGTWQRCVYCQGSDSLMGFVIAESQSPELGVNCFETIAEAVHILSTFYVWPLPESISIRPPGMNASEDDLGGN